MSCPVAGPLEGLPAAHLLGSGGLKSADGVGPWKITLLLVPIRKLIESYRVFTLVNESRMRHGLHVRILVSGVGVSVGLSNRTTR